MGMNDIVAIIALACWFRGEGVALIVTIEVIVVVAYRVSIEGGVGVGLGEAYCTDVVRFTYKIIKREEEKRKGEKN
jgi:hypothetical protein